ncbi:MAG: DUF4388 domain-containing protein [Planctomycetota bacterium]
MSEAPPNTRYWSYARACRRLADEVRQHGDFGDEETSLQHAARLLLEAGERFGAIAGDENTELSEELVQNALNAMLTPPPAAPAEPASTRPTLHATGELASTADLISFLAVNRRTGRLEVVTAAERFLLVFDNGDIVHAQSDRTPEGQRLGDLLVEAGATSPEAIAIALATSSGQRLGSVLWQQGSVLHKQLVRGLEKQIRCQFARMFAQPAREYTFWAGNPSREKHSLRMNTTGLILDGARISDERNQRT